jgi:hypothetical protein
VHGAPGAAIAFSILVSVQFAGPALPLAVLAALVACLLVASSIGPLAKEIPSATVERAPRGAARAGRRKLVVPAAVSTVSAVHLNPAEVRSTL